MSELSETRYDRLKMFYQNLKESVNEFFPITYKGYTLYPPKEIESDKNAYRKYLKVPMKYGNTKQYIITLYSKKYKLYKYDSNFYFIECGDGVPQQVKEYGFGTSMLYSYIAMSVYELILWLTGSRNKYKLKIDDQVFAPIFNFSQWQHQDYDACLKLTMYPEKTTDNKIIPLSIFK
jgi:hypothetical protein